MSSYEPGVFASKSGGSRCRPLGLGPASGLGLLPPSALNNPATKALLPKGVTASGLVKRWPRACSTNSSSLGSTTDSLGAAPKCSERVGPAPSGAPVGTAGTATAAAVVGATALGVAGVGALPPPEPPP